jgi:predicted nucleic acid-binding protein
VIVVDTSALIDLVLRTQDASKVERRVFDPDETLHAPHLVDVEVAQVLRRFVRNGAVDADRGRQALVAFGDLPIRRYPHALLLSRIWELRHNLSAYDAAYVALAELLGAPLLTRDRRIAAAPGHLARVELVA